MKLYRRSEWDNFRSKVFQRDNYTCSICGRTKESGVILQAHHTHYIPGRQPWEYPYQSCITLCKGCHAAEHGLIRPKTGWELTGEYDYGDRSGNCELCGTSIRYAFYIQHKSWVVMSVGSTCCDSLTGNDAAVRREAEIKKLIAKRNRFIESPRWKHTPQGSCIKLDSYKIVIEHVSDNYKLLINGIRGQKSFLTKIDAKMHAFDCIQSGAASKFFKDKSL